MADIDESLAGAASMHDAVTLFGHAPDSVRVRRTTVVDNALQRPSSPLFGAAGNSATGRAIAGSR